METFENFDDRQTLTRLLGKNEFNIYTPSVFCYDKHKKNFDIQFSMKRHDTV